MSPYVGKPVRSERRTARAASLFVACLLAATWLAAVPCPRAAAADDGAIDTIAAQLDACQKMPGHANTMATNGCFSDAIEAADTLLAKTYQATLARLRTEKPEDAETQKDDREIARRLTASQQAWTAYRAAECALQSTDMLGGSGETASELDCEFKMTRERIKFLASWLADDK